MDSLYLQLQLFVMFLLDCHMYPPQESVDYLLDGEPLTGPHDLYLRIMNYAIPLPAPQDRCAQGYHNRAMKILSTILHLLEPLDYQSLADLLELDKEVLLGTLLPLSAV